MKPTAIPEAILYPIGIMNIVKNAGTAISNSSHLIKRSEEAIMTPTITNAGVVTAVVTTLNNGEKNRASKNIIPTTTAVKPDFAPAATPAVDSTYAVVVEVPKMEPTVVPKASAIRALPARGNLSSLTKPA